MPNIKSFNVSIGDLEGHHILLQLPSPEPFHRPTQTPCPHQTLTPDGHWWLTPVILTGRLRSGGLRSRQMVHEISSPKITRAKWTGDVAQAVECLLSSMKP
jgi:hypothetical protein